LTSYKPVNLSRRTLLHGASRQAGKQASRRAGEQASRRAGKQASKSFINKLRAIFMNNYWIKCVMMFFSSTQRTFFANVIFW
jgi:hypothetical protein